MSTEHAPTIAELHYNTLSALLLKGRGTRAPSDLFHSPSLPPPLLCFLFVLGRPCNLDSERSSMAAGAAALQLPAAAKPCTRGYVCAGLGSLWPRLLLPANRHGCLSHQSLRRLLCSIMKKARRTSGLNRVNLRVPNANQRLICIVLMGCG